MDRNYLVVGEAGGKCSTEAPTVRVKNRSQLMGRNRPNRKGRGASETREGIPALGDQRDNTGAVGVRCQSRGNRNTMPVLTRSFQRAATHASTEGASVGTHTFLRKGRN